MKNEKYVLYSPVITRKPNNPIKKNADQKEWETIFKMLKEETVNQESYI